MLLGVEDADAERSEQLVEGESELIDVECLDIHAAAGYELCGVDQ